jgi:hypothetical protein
MSYAKKKKYSVQFGNITGACGNSSEGSTSNGLRDSVVDMRSIVSKCEHWSKET